MTTAALLVVDVQVAHVPLIWRGDELVDRLAGLIAAARAQGVPVIAVQQTGPAGMASGTPGWQLSPGLGVTDTDLRIEKSATDSFYGTELADLLAARNVDTVVLAGVATDYCVDATARSALSHGLNVILGERRPRSPRRWRPRRRTDTPAGHRPPQRGAEQRRPPGWPVVPVPRRRGVQCIMSP